jgi:hypothetical protein
MSGLTWISLALIAAFAVYLARFVVPMESRFVAGLGAFGSRRGMQDVEPPDPRTVRLAMAHDGVALSYERPLAAGVAYMRAAARSERVSGAHEYRRHVIVLGFEGLSDTEAGRLEAGLKRRVEAFEWTPHERWRKSATQVGRLGDRVELRVYPGIYSDALWDRLEGLFDAAIEEAGSR